MAKETILIVEDEPDILELIRFNLEREGYRTVTCETGEDASKPSHAGSPISSFWISCCPAWTARASAAP